MSTDATLAPTRPPAADPVSPVRTFDVRGGGGTMLRAREWGVPDGAPILFVHGWSQTDLCWGRQVSGALAREHRLVAFDLRGHGASEKPADAAAYADPRLWADDLAAVIDATGLDRPTVVAWSYGGFVVGDHLRAYGDDRLGGILLAGAAVLLRPPTFDHIGPGLLDNAEAACSDDPATAIAAIARFLRACTASPLDDELWTLALGWNMIAPPAVRAALLARAVDATDVLGKVSVPVLVAHGRADAIVLPSMAELSLASCPGATASWYDGVGHLPFVEAAERFDRELAAFAARV